MESRYLDFYGYRGGHIFSFVREVFPPEFHIVLVTSKKSKTAFWTCLFLAIVTFAVYWPVTKCEFVHFDDPFYVSNNHQVQKGLTWDNVQWAMTARPMGNWHPLTWMSHMLDCQLYGLNPAGHHLTSLLLHVANSILVFLLLLKMTGFQWRSAFVAALFALHPIHVESVAWVAERKDVLSTFFWCLAILAYVRYVKRSKVDSRPSTTEASSTLDPRPSTASSIFDYFLILLFFALGLLAKPMIVTLPFLLLLLDFWPLGRIQFSREPRVEGRKQVGPGKYEAPMRSSTFEDENPAAVSVRTRSTLEGIVPRSEVKPGQFGTLAGQLPRLVVEKIPLFILSALSCAVTLWAQGYAVGVVHLPLTVRLQNAILSYFNYILKALWPTKLAVMYPFQPAFGIWHIVAIVLVCWLSYRVVTNATRVPYFFTGWFWFLGTLVPVMGLVQVGLQSMADRYSYVPMIGIFIIIAWGGYDFGVHSLFNRPMMMTVAAALVFACIPLTRHQISYWHDTVALFDHALKCTSNNFSAETALATELSDRGDLAGAAEHFRRATQIYPKVPQPHIGLAYTLMKQGKYDQALPELQEVVRILPDYPEGLGNLGLALVANGRVDEGIAKYQAALRKDPNMPETHYNLGCALVKKGKIDEALEQFRTALQLSPKSSMARSDYAMLLLNQGMLDESKAEWSILLRDEPQNPKGHMGLGMAFAREKNWMAAIGHYNEAVRLQPGNPELRIHLGEALVASGDLAGAIQNFSDAIKANPTNAVLRSYLGTTKEQAGDIREALTQYREALALNPRMPFVLNNMAWVLATDPDAAVRSGSEAVRLAEQACELTDNKLPIMLGTLSAAYAEVGEFDKAVETAKRAEALATEAGKTELAAKHHQMGELFLARKPFRQSSAQTK